MPSWWGYFVLIKAWFTIFFQEKCQLYIYGAARAVLTKCYAFLCVFLLFIIKTDYI